MLRKRTQCSMFLLFVACACSGRADRVLPSKSTPDAGASLGTREDDLNSEVSTRRDAGVDGGPKTGTSPSDSMLLDAGSLEAGARQERDRNDVPTRSDASTSSRAMQEPVDEPRADAGPGGGCVTEAVEPAGGVDVFSELLRGLGSRSGGVLSSLDGSNTLAAVDHAITRDHGMVYETHATNAGGDCVHEYRTTATARVVSEYPDLLDEAWPVIVRAREGRVYLESDTDVGSLSAAARKRLGDDPRTAGYARVRLEIELGRGGQARLLDPANTSDDGVVWFAFRATCAAPISADAVQCGPLFMAATVDPQAMRCVTEAVDMGTPFVSSFEVAGKVLMSVTVGASDPTLSNAHRKPYIEWRTTEANAALVQVRGCGAVNVDEACVPYQDACLVCEDPDELFTLCDATP